LKSFLASNRNIRFRLSKTIGYCILFFVIVMPVHSQSQPSLYLKGIAFVQKNQVDSAIFYYSKLLETKNQDYKLLNLRGQAYYKSQKYPEALSDFFAANKLSADIADFGLAQCYASAGNLEMALEYLKKHLSSRYKLSQYIIRNDPAFAKFENNRDWILLWQNDWYDKNDAQNGEARFLFNNKDWMGEINYVTDLVKENSKRHELLYYRAKSYFEMGNYNASLSDFNVAIGVFHHNYEYYHGRAKVFAKMDKTKDAISDYSTAIEIAPEAFSLYLERADLYISVHNFEAAQRDIELYLDLFGNDSLALFLAGKCQCARGNCIDALVYYNRLVKDHPSNAKYYYARAEAYQKTGMFTYSLKDYDTCIRFEPSNINALRERGKVFFAQDNKKDACNDWKKASNVGDFESNNLYLDNCR
jgi:tetratricopeptide (TPR) repeat protein